VVPLPPFPPKKVFRSEGKLEEKRISEVSPHHHKWRV